MTTMPTYDPLADTPAPTPGHSTGGRPTPGLPVGPLALFLITAVALAVTVAVVRWHRPRRFGVDVTDALAGVDSGPAVPDGHVGGRGGRAGAGCATDYLDGGSSNSPSSGEPRRPELLGIECAPCLAGDAGVRGGERIELGDEVTIVGVDVADTRGVGRRDGGTDRGDLPQRPGPRSQIFGVFAGIALPRTVLDATATARRPTPAPSQRRELTELGTTDSPS